MPAGRPAAGTDGGGVAPRSGRARLGRSELDLVRVADVIEEMFGVRYTQAGVSLLLGRMDWSVQRFTPLLIDASRPCRHAPGTGGVSTRHM
ncbi:hypothetical protein FDG2_0859 [Candidatus Protofrankia californiensis]|uniref:Winged helix-turn helix domain-containing protein n=1 Tax=Candidatus Protofrankia californiensis TaxID=1839754 RepID=A0A1C3NUJ9_9ACTN|nr:hypothetical protein FDG2_0859 [Candidatus Protofrankia californiensis]